jgi:hypothetical protein
MGELISTDPAKNSEVEKNYTINLNPSWGDVFPVVVIYKHDPNATIKYSYVNSYR